ncbi:MAG TPA: protein kinase [Kofleriaceae bacterium]
MIDDDASTLAMGATLADRPVRSSHPSFAPSSDRDRYTLGEQIGRGGMGEVRLARDVRIDRDVAVKLMRPDTRDDVSTARFFREARVQGRLDHPAIPPVYDLGVDEHGSPYFVMKRLTGTTLFDVLAGHPDAAKWPRRQLLAKLVDVCLAVELAHSRAIVHRDLKPSNIMLGDFGEVYVLDWGLARVIDAPIDSAPSVFTASGDTAAGDVLGTPGFMAPEQIRDPAVTAAADVFSLGCILYELAIGQPALPRGTPALAMTLDAACHRPSQRVADVPPELDDLCARATAAMPLLRPTARELADGIQAYLDGDRDLVRRTELAAQHAAHARASATSRGDDARADAVREAGRALALDANNAEAQAVLGRLLLDAPVDLPRDALDESERDRANTRLGVLRSLGRGYAVVSIIFASVFVLKVNHPIVLLVGVVACAITSVLAIAGARRGAPRIGSPLVAALIILNTGTLWLGSIVFGPLLVMPVFLVGSIGVALSQPTGFRWPTIVLPQITGVLGPLALEWLGVLPSTYHIGPDGLTLTPWVVTLTPMLTLCLVLIAIGSQLVVTTMVQLARATIQTRTEDRLYAIRWHLEQLLPKRGEYTDRVKKS